MRYLTIVIALFVCSAAYAGCPDSFEKKLTYDQQYFTATTPCPTKTSSLEPDDVKNSAKSDDEFSFSQQKRKLQANSAAKLFLLLLYSVGSTTDS